MGRTGWNPQGTICLSITQSESTKTLGEKWLLFHFSVQSLTLAPLINLTKKKKKIKKEEEEENSQLNKTSIWIPAMDEYYVIQIYTKMNLLSLIFLKFLLKSLKQDSKFLDLFKKSVLFWLEVGFYLTSYTKTQNETNTYL